LKIAEWIGYLSFYHQNHIDALKVFVVGRLVFVIIGILTIPLVYLIGNKVGGAKVGILSALFLSILPLHVLNSHFIVPDVGMCFFVMLTFYITLASFEKKSKVIYPLQGLFCGLAIATKYSAAPIVVVIVLSHLLQRDVSWKKKAVAYPSMLLGFFIGEPYAFVRFNEFREALRVMRTSHTSGEGSLILSMVSNIWFYAKNSALYCMGIPAFIISLLGIPVLIKSFTSFEDKRKSQANVLIFTSIIVFFLFALISKFQFIRFSLPVIMFLCVPCAIYMVSVKNLKLRYILIGLSVLFSLVLSLRNVKIMTEEHTATSAYKWVDENVEPGSSLFQEWREIPPLQPRRYKVFDYTLVDPESGFKLKPDYVVRTDTTPVFYNKHLLEQLNKDYRLLATFEKKAPIFPGIEIKDNSIPQDLKYTHPKISIYGLSITLDSLPTKKYSINNKLINFKDNSSHKYLRRGWSQAESYGTWAEGKESVMIVNFEETCNYLMRIKATPYTVSDMRQVIKIFVNDELIGECAFTKPFMQWETFEIKIPAKRLRPGTTRIRFIYRYAISPKEINRGPDIRKLAVAFESIEFAKL
jgi:hypothetical protein